jgi:large subunit ribosomal protein L13
MKRTPPNRDAAKSIGKERDRSDSLLLRTLVKVLVDTGIGFTYFFGSFRLIAMRTFSAKASDIERRWYIVDANNQPLGRVAVKVANLLRGKQKPIFTPHVDTGDFVIVINAEKVRLSGKKETQKEYMSFSGYVGGHKSETVERRRARRPELLIEHAVKGMIPHNRLGRSIFTKLKVYRGEEHPHGAQQPISI